MTKFHPRARQIEELLISSAKLDVPPPNAKKRALNLLGVGSSVIATAQVTGVTTASAATQVAGATSAAATGVGTATATGATSGFVLALVKGVAIGAVTGTLAYGSLTLRQHDAPSVPAPTVTGAPAVGTAPKRIAVERMPPSERAMSQGSPVSVLDEPVSAPPTASRSHVAQAAGRVNASEAEQPLSGLPRRLPRDTHAGRGDNDVRGSREVGTFTQPAEEVASAGVTQSQPPSEAQPSLQSERAIIELAQSLVRSGAPRAALRTLSTHAARYPKPQLGPEATLVRIEALIELGELPEAQRLGSAFLASQPDGTYAQRVRTLLNR